MSGRSFDWNGRLFFGEPRFDGGRARLVAVRCEEHQLTTRGISRNPDFPSGEIRTAPLLANEGGTLSPARVLLSAAAECSRPWTHCENASCRTEHASFSRSRKVPPPSRSSATLRFASRRQRIVGRASVQSRGGFVLLVRSRGVQSFRGLLLHSRFSCSIREEKNRLLDSTPPRLANARLAPRHY